MKNHKKTIACHPLCEIAGENYLPFRELIDKEIEYFNSPINMPEIISSEIKVKIEQINNKSLFKEFYKDANFKNGLENFIGLNIHRKNPNPTLSIHLFTQKSVFLCCTMGYILCAEKLYQEGVDQYLKKFDIEYEGYLSRIKSILSTPKFFKLISKEKIEETMSFITKTLANEPIGIRLKLIEFLNTNKSGNNAVSKIATMLYGAEILTYFEIKREHIRGLSESIANISAMIFGDEAPCPNTVATHLTQVINWAAQQCSTSSS